jgi:hypothetical protein
MTSVLLIVYDTISSIIIDKYDDYEYHINTGAKKPKNFCGGGDF